MSNSELFIPIKFNTSVQLKPNEIGINIEDIIYTKLKNNLENMCSKHGYIKKGSIKIIKRSLGQLKIAHFNGNLAYDLQCSAEICNPAEKSIIKCKVKAKNSMGLLAEGYYDNEPILQVIVPKISAGFKSDVNLDEIKIGENINIEVCGKKFLLYDKYISIIGRVIKDKEEHIENIIDVESDVDEEQEDNNDIIDNFTDIDDEKIEEDDEDVDDEEDEEKEDKEDDKEDEDEADDDIIDDIEEDDIDDFDEIDNLEAPPSP